MVEATTSGNAGAAAAEETKSQASRHSSQRSATSTQMKMPDRDLVEKSFLELPPTDEENDIMNHLDYRKLEKIYGDYNLMGGTKNELDMEKFIAIMLHHLPTPTNEVVLVRNLMELFREIDVNGDEDLEWVEFTNHIIDLGMVKKDSVFVDTIKDYLPSDIRDVNHDQRLSTSSTWSPSSTLLSWSEMPGVSKFTTLGRVSSS